MKSSVGERFEIRELKSPKGKISYELRGWDIAEKRIRKRFKTRLEAIGMRQILNAEIDRSVSASAPKHTRLTENELIICERAVETIGIENLMTAVHHYQKTYQNPSEVISIADAVDMFEEDEEISEMMATRQIYEVCRIGRNLAEAFPGLELHQVTQKHISEFLNGDKDKTKSSKRTKLGSLFNWALDEGHRFLDRHPSTGATERKIKRPRDEDVAILTVAQARALLRASITSYNGSLVPYVAIKLFAGIRSDEIQRLTWDDVNMKTGYIMLSSRKSKTGSARSVQIHDNLRRWLEPHYLAKESIIPKGFANRFASIRHRAGWKKARDKKNPKNLPEWPRNALRHTSVTYHLKVHGESETTEWAGHAAKVMYKHYVGLATIEDAEEFWDIYPDNIDTDNVVSIATG